ncbi:MAG: LPP20 family lipoprotein [Sulfurimonas sp.]|nr:LPP20 family lipoprotein [Sulfurimonas sp.]
MKRVISSSIFVALITTIITGCSMFAKESSSKDLAEPIPVEREQLTEKETSAPKISNEENCGVQATGPSGEPLLTKECKLVITVLGQGVAPVNTVSPAQAYGLAKRAAIADGYRLIAEKVKGVRVEGNDLIKNMMVKQSTIRTCVDAVIKNANVTETTFKDGLCEVEMEIVVSHSQFAQ